MASITNIVTVQLIPEGELASRDNMNVVAILTSQQDGPLDSNNRYGLYRDQSSVAADFGTGSKMNGFATSLFGTQPNPINAGGVLVAGYWRGQEETVAATAGVLEGAQVNEVTVIDQLQQINDGAFDVDVDGTTENLSGLDFQTVIEMEDVVDLLNTNLTGATAEFTDQRIVITSDTTGATSTMGFAVDPGTGTFVGEILALTDGSGASTTDGAAEETLDAETMLEAITTLAEETGIKGAMFIDPPTDSDARDLSEWAQANDVLLYDVFDQADDLNIDPDNIVWELKLAGRSNYRMLYRKDGNRKMAASYMARAHTVNFRADNTALTMHLKELSVPAESFTQTEITGAQNVGLDIYTTFKDTPAVLTSGANDFTDNRYNLIAFVDALQTDMYNLLKQTGTKIPQTRRGVNQLVDQAEKTTRGFVRAGVFAPGTWSSPDYFGNRETFEENIARNGYYWLAGSLADQAQSSRQNRESPVIQGAVKNAGAIHSVDMIVNFNL